MLSTMTATDTTASAMTAAVTTAARQEGAVGAV